MSEQLVSLLPKMLSGEELISALTVLPKYDPIICLQNEAVRLMALSDLYGIYVPSIMSQEIYSKLYLALLRSLQKKETHNAIRQKYENNKAIRQQASNGIIGGSDSFTIIGTSGIGKSSSINRAVELISECGTLKINTTQSDVIPCLVVQCPFDSSVKGLLLEILRKADEELGTKYYHYAIKSRSMTTDVLIGAVSTVALNHIGLLIVDEIQHVVNSKNGKLLVNMLTQLINNSGISICMVGTPESAIFFEQAMQLARRSLGLQYHTLGYNQYFCDFCTTVFHYQYTKHKVEISDEIIEWLYEHSNGVISVVISLIHDAQEIAILNGEEILCIETLNAAYQQRMTLMHSYLRQEAQRKHSTSSKKEKAINRIADIDACKNSITSLIESAKCEHAEIVSYLKRYVTIEEVLL